MKKKLISALLCAALTLSLAACGGSSAGSAPSDSGSKAESSDNAGSGAGAGVSTVEEGVLTMATNAYFPPYEYYENNDIVGIDAEIAAAIAKKLGLTLKIEDMEFDSIITAVSSGRADMGLAGMTVSEERLRSINFSDSYASGVQVVIVTQDSDIASVDDLQGKKIGVQLGTTGDMYCADDYGDENVERFNKGADAVMALETGKVDCVVIDNEPAKSFVAVNDDLKILDTEYITEDYAAAIAKENTALLDAVNEALGELSADGTLKAIIDKYINADE